MRFAVPKFLSRFEALVQFIKFSLVGVSNTVISYATYTALVFIGLHYIVANGIAFVVSVLNSFFWNSRYVFKTRGDAKILLKMLFKTFLLYGFTGLVLNSLLLSLLIEVLHISKFLAPVFPLLVTVPLNFLLNKYWAFKQAAHPMRDR